MEDGGSTMAISRAKSRRRKANLCGLASLRQTPTLFLFLRSSFFIPCFVRGSLLLFLILLATSGCRSKAPYEGKSVAQLRRMLQDSDTKVQVQGAFGISELGTQAREAMPDLLDALKSDDALVRQNAALALGNIGTEAGDGVTRLAVAAP